MQKKKPDKELTPANSKPTEEKKSISKSSDEPQVKKPTSGSVITRTELKSPESHSQSMPKLSRLEKLKEEAKKEIEANRKNEKNFEISVVRNVVNQYIRKLSSPYVKNILTDLKVEMEGKTIQIFVPSALTEDMVKEEQALLEQIRTVMPENGFEIRIIVDKELFPEYKELKPKKILSNKEKFEMFQDRNPLISKFVERFDLKIDTD
jgi:hypothetical protein